MWETSFAKQLWYSLPKARTYYKEMYSNFSFSRFYWYYKKSRIRQSSLNGNIELGRETGLEQFTNCFLCTYGLWNVCSVSYIQHMILHTFYTLCYSSTSSLKVSLSLYCCCTSSMLMEPIHFLLASSPVLS